MTAETITFDSLGDTIVARLFLPPSVNPAPIIIIVHGAIDYKEHFYELAEYFRDAGFAVLVPDMHGHGESGGARYHVRMAQWVPDIENALEFLSSHERLDETRVGIFGFSSGGTAGLMISAVDSRIKCLVTLDATVRPIVSKLEVFAFKVLGWAGLKRRQRSGKDLYLPLYDVAKKQPVATNLEVSREFIEDPYLVSGYKRYPVPGAVESLVVHALQDAEKINIPVCVIHGEDDAIDKPDSAKLLHSRLQCEKTMHIIPGNGHVGHMDNQKDKVMAISRDWFLKHL